ncbi:MAG: DUF3089 domain-containing protein, partial [Pseudomonadota bacterium]
PDYSLRSNWSGWPDDANPAERLPTGLSSPPQSERLADAFFLHPTTYGGKEHWVQPMDYEPSRQGTDFGTVSIQASAFNECCRVYAPRFRQANLAAYSGDHARTIMEIGYKDVKRAFHHFLDTIDPDSPIVLASHSQGSFQMMRLVMEEVDGTPLMDRVVAIYAIGHRLPMALIDDGYEEIQLCSEPTETGCFISWDTHRGDRKPSPWSDKEEEVLWNGTDYSGFAPSQPICVNPITWRTDSESSSKHQHLGALPGWKRPASIDESLGELIKGVVSAHCEQGEFSNWLFVNPDLDERLKADGLFGYFERNMHGSDYGLFWANIRSNATERVQAFIAARDQENAGGSEE